jgi:hypothetical protein
MILIFIDTGVGGVFCILFIGGKVISITSSLKSSSELASRRYFANNSRYITAAGGTIKQT